MIISLLNFDLLDFDLLDKILIKLKNNQKLDFIENIELQKFLLLRELIERNNKK